MAGIKLLNGMHYQCINVLYLPSTAHLKIKIMLAMWYTILSIALCHLIWYCIFESIPSSHAMTPFSWFWRFNFSS